MPIDHQEHRKPGRVPGLARYRPHLVLRGGRWYCYTFHSFSIAKTPQQAYDYIIACKRNNALRNMK